MPFLLYRMSLFFELIKGKIFDTVSLPVDVSEVVLGRACMPGWATAIDCES